MLIRIKEGRGKRMFVISKRGFKAQFTMKTMLEIVLMLIVYAQIYPTLVEPYIEQAIANTEDSIVAALLSILPFLIVAMILIGVFSYSTIRGRRR